MSLSTNPQKFGLGCSKLGSINGLTIAESEALLQRALELGVRFFDTSSVYGQGDSERALGNVLAQRSDVIICTKGGKHLTKKGQLLSKVKGVLRFMARNSSKASAKAGAARETPLPTNWSPDFLLSSLDGSLRRLRRDSVDMYLLHSPSAAVIRQGEAMGALAKAKEQGKAKQIGVSIDDPEAAMAALDDPRIEVIQVALFPNHPYEAFLTKAADANVTIIAREILGGKAGVMSAGDKGAFIRERIAIQEDDPRVSFYLLGTTKASNLEAAWGSVKSTG